LVIFGFFGASIASAIPSLASQVTRLLQELPAITARVLPTLDIDVRSVTQQIAPISENVVRVTVSIFSNVITLLTVLVFSFYFLMERRNAEGLLISWMGEAVASRVMETLRAIELKLGAWARGQIFLMFFIGILVFIGLTLLHVDYALPLAILAGILEIVPIIGPIISAAPAVVIALATSPFLALSVVAMYFIIQQIENNVVVPFVMRKSVGLSPLLTIVALMVGGKLSGFTGVFLAVPVLLVIQVLIGMFFAKQEKGK
jgi:predicted PurR-regulated permease PerM